jgi:holo-[acyl-carrier protein] synthase
MTPFAPRMSVGIDLVDTRSIAASIATFGDRFLRRIFTEAEVAYANEAPDLAVARLAARFAAKEATVKALDLAERGVGWREIEVVRSASGAPALALHGHARSASEEAGSPALSLSISHEGDYATAVVLAYRDPRDSRESP